MPKKSAREMSTQTFWAWPLLYENGGASGE